MELGQLPVHNGFRLRGGTVTRVETFVDAAFAFAVTLLVVSFGAMPESFAELYEALRRFPAFIAGFAILALFWHAHYRYCRRLGLENTWVVVLSLALVAVALFYVYPLRMVMSAAMHFMTAGWAPSEFQVASLAEFRLIFVIYGMGFAALALLVVALNRHALHQAAALRLDAAERLILRSEIVVHAVYIGCALLSMAIALLLPETQGWWLALPGLAYGLMAVILPVYGYRAGRQVEARLAEREPAHTSIATGRP